VTSSSGADQRTYQMVMSKGDPGYTVNPRRVLFAETGTELKISPLLDGIRSLSGEKIQWYLAAELRDRIRTTHYDDKEFRRVDCKRGTTGLRLPATTIPTVLAARQG
jgi:hypothetical protein